MFGSIPLEFLVSLVAHYRGSAPGQPSLGDIDMVALHPFRPVAPITAMDKTSTFEEEGGSGHDRCFLKGIRTVMTNHDAVVMGCSTPSDCQTTHQVQSSGEDGRIRNGSWLTAVQQKLEAFHSLTNGSQIHHVLILHGLLTGCKVLLEPMRS